MIYGTNISKQIYNIPMNIINYKIVYKFMCNLVAAKWLLKNVQASKHEIYADYMWSFLGGLRVTNLTIRLACPSVCLSVRLSVCLSINILLVNTITQQILIALAQTYTMDLFQECIG